MNESQPEQDAKISFLTELILQRYDVLPVSLHRFPSDSGKHIYQVRLANGMNRVIRIAKGSGTTSLFDIVHLLTFFERHNYPAERVILTKDHIAISLADNWHFLMTTFLVGTPLAYAPTTLSLLGKVVGQLHALKNLLPYSLPQSPMLPTGELAFAQKQLATIASLVPKQFFKEYELLETALLSFNRGTNLPTTLIHGDCHPANALLTAPEQVTLFDWEEAGIGSASLDVGFLLANCDGKAPWDTLSPAPFSLDASIQAVIEGYSQHYKLTVEELNYLPDAIRFRSLVFGACSFAASIAQDKNAAFSQWWWHRYQAAEEIADKAKYYFEQYRIT